MRDQRSTSIGTWPLRLLAASALAIASLLLVPLIASAHLERPSYWPDPAPDRAISPPAGGEVPEQESLRSALKENAKTLFVACKGRNGSTSMGLVRRYVDRAVAKGYRLRPSEQLRELSRGDGKRLVKLNRKLAKRCEFSDVQDAVDAAGNNDRVVVMPGRYTEQDSRRELVNDPRCADLTQVDTSGRETPSFEYQATCPHDQNLVYVQGRAVSKTPAPEPPLDDRHGIPDLGRCIKCNLQIEGSGPRPVDVVIDAAQRGKKRGVEARPGPAKKDVVLRADRADGIVVTNMTLKGGQEHGFYTEETDGYLLNKVKMFWNLDYGNLSFTADHGLFKNCDGYAAGDAALYPGAAPETGEQADKSFYPDAPRINTTIKKCDMRGSTLGYSGSMGNAVRITKSDIYGNAAGISSDTLSASGHPGFPSDSMEIDNNNIFSNNLNLYSQDIGLEPLVGIPVGTGILWPGMNNGKVHDNYIFDNWRYGAMLFAIPDSFVTPENEIEPGVSCETATPVEDPNDNTGQSTSCGNRFFDNKMGQAPPGWSPPAGFDQSSSGSALTSGAKRIPNGLDWWWDEYPTNTGNCWSGNEGANGRTSGIDSDPPVGPVEGVNEPGTLPDNCNTSIGNPATYPVKAGQLIECSTWDRGDQDDDFAVCDWFRTPPDPSKPTKRSGSAGAKAAFAPTDDPMKLMRRAAEAFGAVELGSWEQRPQP